jgi:hypothetical protein
MKWMEHVARIGRYEKCIQNVRRETWREESNWEALGIDGIKKTKVYHKELVYDGVDWIQLAED